MAHSLAAKDRLLTNVLWHRSVDPSSAGQPAMKCTFWQSRASAYSRAVATLSLKAPSRPGTAASPHLPKCPSPAIRGTAEQPWALHWERKRTHWRVQENLLHGRLAHGSTELLLGELVQVYAALHTDEPCESSASDRMPSCSCMEQHQGELTCPGGAGVSLQEQPLFEEKREVCRKLQSSGHLGLGIGTLTRRSEYLWGPKAIHYISS